jgi:hypothetical protein
MPPHWQLPSSFLVPLLVLYMRGRADGLESYAIGNRE